MMLGQEAAALCFAAGAAHAVYTEQYGHPPTHLYLGRAEYRVFPTWMANRLGNMTIVPIPREYCLQCGQASTLEVLLHAEDADVQPA